MSDQDDVVSVIDDSAPFDEPFTGGAEDPTGLDALYAELPDGSVIELVNTDDDREAEIAVLALVDGTTVTTEDPGPGMHVTVEDADGNIVMEGTDTSLDGKITDDELVVGTDDRPADTDGTRPEDLDVDDPTSNDVIPPGQPGGDDPADIVVPVDAPAEFEPVDPSTVVIDPEADTIIGNPAVEDEYWLYQGRAGTCAPTSVAMILEDVLGVTFESNQDVVERALEMGLISYDETTDEWSGMNDVQMLTLLESYGVDCNMRYGDLDTLLAYLDSGHSIMVGVDSDEIRGNADDTTDQGVDANHELVITGIDPVNRVVYLNNPNNADGPCVIPLEQFLDAWGDDNNSMIVTDLPTEQAGDAIASDVIADLTDHEPGGDTPITGENLAPDTEIEVTGGAPAPGGGSTDSAPLIPLEDPSTIPAGLVKLLILPFGFVVLAAHRARRKR
jgi:hypothetical protein